jgi:hypothetical protein
MSLTTTRREAMRPLGDTLAGALANLLSGHA